MKSILVFLIFYSFIYSQSVFARRVLLTPPIAIMSVAGANVCADPSGSTDAKLCKRVTPCVTADLKGVEIIEEGVRAISHVYAVQLVNVSNIEQTVTVKYANEGAFYQLSANNNVGIPNTTPFDGKLGEISRTFKIAAGSLASTLVKVNCSGSSCSFYHEADTVPSYDTSSPTVCKSLLSTVRISFEVTEDKGAIIAQITTAAHRNSGTSDKLLTPLPFYHVNGGRAF